MDRRLFYSTKHIINFWLYIYWLHIQNHHKVILSLSKKRNTKQGCRKEHMLMNCNQIVEHSIEKFFRRNFNRRPCGSINRQKLTNRNQPTIYTTIFSSGEKTNVFKIQVSILSHTLPTYFLLFALARRYLTRGHRRKQICKEHHHQMVDHFYSKASSSSSGRG